MKKLILLTFTAILCFASLTLTHAQITGVSNFLKIGTTGAEGMLENYIAPYANGLGANLASGWYNNAKTHDLGGFDITINTGVAFVPSDATEYDLNSIDWDAGSLFSIVFDETNSMTPTIAGEKENGPTIQLVNSFGGKDYLAAELENPKGTGVKIVPSAMVQAGIGLPYGVEITGRFCPTLTIKDGEVGFWGIGLKKDIKQHIPVLDKVPILQIAGQFGYSRLNAAYGLSFGPEAYGVTLDDFIPGDQKFEGNMSSATGNLIVGANLPVIAFYGSVGFAWTKASYRLIGNYPIPTNYDFLADEPVLTVYTDPITLDIPNSYFRANVGMRIKMGPMAFHTDYSYANYSVLTVGLGVSIR